MKQILETLERCETLLRAVVDFVDKNPVVGEYTVYYDEADCDGYCLKDDCESHLDSVCGAILQAKSGVSR